MAVVREHLRAPNERLRKAIHASGLSLEEVAHRCGMDPKSLERAIGGRLPHPRNRYAIATVLHHEVIEIWPEADGVGVGRSTAPKMAGVERVYATRSDFLSDSPPESLFTGASSITSAGLSNNLLCQHYADQRLEQLIALGAEVFCLFLDPDGDGTAAREREEGYEAGHLAHLTALNISLLKRLRARLPESVQGRLRLATYDETVRFNIIVVERVEESTAVVQPYLPHSRGVDSPTLVVRRSPEPGLFETFHQVVTDIIDKATPC